MKKSLNIEPICVEEHQAALMLGVSARKMLDLWKSGKIPRVNIDSRARYSVADLRRFVERNRTMPNPQESTIE